VKGHVDDYWDAYGSTVDPYYGNWAEHGYADCTADFMGTNQYVNWQNSDGSTRFYFYPNGAPLYDYTDCEPGGKRDGCHGIRLFAESRGYNVVQNYNQLIDARVPTGGFTYANFKAEIDAGRPVIIQVTGHSMLGYGYTDPDTIYIHDTWGHTDHSMTWGGTYAGMEHYGVTVIVMPYPCGNMNVNPTSWSTTILCGNTDSKTVSVSATGGTVEGVTVSKVSGPNWLSVSPTNLGDIPSGSSNTFTITAAQPSETSGDFPYTVRVSNTCGTPSSRDVTGTITVFCPELSYSPASHDFGDKCEGETDSTTFELWNSGTGTLTYSLSETCGWVEVNPTSGSSTGEHDGITVDIDTAGLSEGSYICNISISSNGGNGTFTVTVNIIPSTGSIYVTSEPSGAKIYLDNKYEGKTPHTITEVPPGYHTIKLTLMGYHNWTKRIQVTAGETAYVHATLTPLPICPDLVITGKWLCWPDNCTICYNVTNIGNETAPACHNTTLYVDGVAVAYDHVPVDLAPGESYIGCFDGYTGTYTPPSDEIRVCADNNETLDELDEDNNCLTNIWMCGDVTGDGRVRTSDGRRIFRHLTFGVPIDNLWAADVTGDGRVRTSDGRRIFRHLTFGDPLNCKCGG
jgi:hypothetical protein